jgi:putative hydrolase of the HAD superfamily
MAFLWRDRLAAPMKPTVLMVDVDGVVVRQPDPSGWSARIKEGLGIPRQALQDRFFKPW